jgi:hypothetical protein
MAQWLVLFVVSAAYAGEVQRPRPPDGSPRQQYVKIDRMTREEFDKLPDEQIVELEGERTTKRELRRRAKAAQATLDREVERRRTEFANAERMRQDARNARAWGELNRLQLRALDPAYAEQRRKLVQEMTELAERSQKATSDGQARLEREAGDLLRRLHELTR